MSALRFFHQNLRGLNPAKYQFLSKIVSNRHDHFRFALIAETWWPRWKEWETHPFTVLVSTPPTDADRENATGHQQGGLAIIAAPDEKQKITLIKRTNYYIYFRYENTKILFVYLPPSLSISEIESIFQDIPSVPDLLVGDINTRLGRMNNDPTRTNERYHLMMDQAAHFNLEFVRAENNSRQWHSRVDHLFANASLGSKWAFYPSRINSDHGYMDIQIDAASTSPATPHGEESRRYYIRKLRNPRIASRYRDYYKEEFGEYAPLWQSIEAFRTGFLHPMPPRDELQEIVNAFDLHLTENVMDAAETILGSYRVNDVRLVPDNILNQLDTAQSNVEAQIMFKRAQRGHQVPLQASAENVNIFEEGVEHFRSIWSREEQVSSPPSAAFQPLEVPFTIGHLKIKIRKYPAAKAPGIDNIHITLLKHLLETPFTKDLFELFALCYQAGVTPTSWNEGLTCLLPKDKENPVITNTRPVSLTRLFRRLFEGLLHSAWTTESWAKLHRAQSGCRRGFSTFSQCVLNDHLSKFPEFRRGPVSHFSVLLDISKAFDSVRHQDILRKLQERGCPPQVLSLIFHLFMNQTRTRLIINGSRSESIELTNGIFQGSVLSPLLFMIWIDDLCQDLNGDDQTYSKALFFVDDIIIKAKNADELEFQLQVCEEWANRHGIRFNATKSTVLKPPARFPAPNLSIQGGVIPVRDQDKYLGVPTSCHGTNYLALVQKNFNRAISLLGFLETKGSSWPEWVKIQIHKTYLESQLQYMGPGIHAWLQTNPDATISIEENGQDRRMAISVASTWLLKRVFRWIFDRGRDTYFATLRHMTLLLTPTERWERLAIQFYHHQIRLADDNPICEIRDLWSNYFPVFWPANMYLPRIFQRPAIYPDFVVAQQNSRRNGLRIQTFLRNELIRRQRIEHANRITPRYILPTARAGSNSHMDGCLSIRDHELRRLAIRWRINGLFIHRLCPGCNQAFKRSCINECNLFDGFREIDDGWFQLCDAERRDLLAEDRRLRPQTTQRVEDARDYNILDFLLNHQLYPIFGRALRHIELQIDGERA